MRVRLSLLNLLLLIHFAGREREKGKKARIEMRYKHNEMN